MHQAIDPADLTPAQRHKLTIGTIVPRPIAWTTSVSPDGHANLAPFSYFMGCHSYVPAVAVSIGSRADGTPKDTRANIAATGEFVINVVTDAVLERMNITAAAFPAGVSEIEITGLTTLPSTVVRPPRIAESPIQLECRVLHALDLGEAPRLSTLFVGQVVMWHIDPALLQDDYKIDQAAIHAVARMGGPFYTRATDPFPLTIPDWHDLMS